MKDDSKDNQILSKLYKEGAKESPSAELDQKILEYAAKKNKSKHATSHFSGGWKVPLSLAASVVVVFALLIQLDQSNIQQDLPAVPAYEESDAKPVTEDEDLGNNIEFKSSTTIKNGKQESRKKLEQESVSGPQSVLEKSQQLDEFKLNNESKESHAPAERSAVAEPSAKTPAPETEISKPQRSLDRMQEISKDSIDEGGRARSVEPDQNKQVHEEAVLAEDEAEFAPLPVEDWLLMIEKLIARKDYAEAARQLEKFKQAHPKVNVEDLEAKIP